ncbi:protein-arginine deiminase type-2 isoform X2 [Zootoca vivipara]|uniref:protein-arginine deiminase type-2 isoform X2 n=1 Tax=Zootoca vivipara TaxID=8524 RepID=UPI00293BD9D6|nr:protein-arginine deiminase type-2 isoform X2 [Zootoca vivipara]
MGHDRTLRLQFGNRIEVVCVVGTRLCTDVYGAAPADAVTFAVKHSDDVEVEIVRDGQSEHAPANGGTQWPLDPKTTLSIRMTRPSTEANDNKVTVGYYGENGGHPIDQAGVFLTGIEISLDVDADRDGVVEKNHPKKAAWTWGPDGQGAVLLVNCDKENPYTGKEDCQDDKVFTKEDPFFGQRYIHVLGPRKLFHVVKYTGGSAEMEFFVEGLRFPDDGFDGLVTIHVSLLEPVAEGIPQTPIFTDTVVFRIAPWIMTPNTLAPLNVFVCSVKDNYLFLKEIKNLVSKSNCHMSVCSRYMNRGDRWMQDEIEFGYIHAPHKAFPVVLDSPRNGGLEDFAVKEILGPDFGYVSREPLFEEVTSLDSFGNLEVSPPVTANGKEYPLGRILIGTSFPLSAGRRMTKVVRDFLYAQKVQSPVELYSDWLTVGHVDEFLTFVPIPGKKQFRMLMASPSACYKLFREKQKEGHGEAVMFKGYTGTDTKRVTVNKVLSNEVMVQENQYVQRCIDWNRDILKKELGLAEKDIIDLPALFKIDKQGKAMAYFPNMVNMIVLSRDLGIPKPFGPIIEAECCLEQHVCSLLEPLGLTCTFIDDVSSYHKQLGEVHCGTNVQRKPSAFKWWDVTP